jgi:hypothetical protein
LWRPLSEAGALQRQTDTRPSQLSVVPISDF